MLSKFGIVVLVIISFQSIIYMGIYMYSTLHVPLIKADSTAARNKKRSSGYIRSGFNDSDTKFLTIFTTFSERELPRFRIQNNTLCNYEKFPKHLTERAIFSSDGFHLRRDGKCWLETVSNNNDSDWNIINLEPHMTAAGRPVLREMFIETQKRFNTDLYMYSNGDILFHVEKLITSLEEVKRFTKAHNIRRFIVFGARHEANFYSSHGTVEIISGLDEEIIQRGQSTKLGQSNAQDYFITSKTSFPWDAVPDYVISLPAFDNWLLMFSNKADIATFDITATNLAVHQAGAPKFIDSNYQKSMSSNRKLWDSSIISYVGSYLNCCKWKTVYKEGKVIMVKNPAFNNKCIAKLKIPVENLLDEKIFEG
ncbi:unnamed protein product [Owenia fusiformis]|uniref:Uncharacterized protein n=1 Tax=Owenia fusiformis TaxID=6347 RepID=A0A8J1Y2S3_OWEFU|nr:unnamed protein product [Owenia fusiformis]